MTTAYFLLIFGVAQLMDPPHIPWKQYVPPPDGYQNVINTRRAYKTQEQCEADFPAVVEMVIKPEYRKLDFGGICVRGLIEKGR